MAKKGRIYTASRRAIEPDRLYTPLEGVRLLKSLEGAKFDETVEVHFRLGVDVRHADQIVRGTTVLPHGTGKEMRVAVFAEGDKAREAEEAGADIVGTDDLAKQIQEGVFDFDIAIATPDMMGTVGKLGRILGPRGLMPNPKSGTVTFDVGKAVSRRQGRQGRVPHRPLRHHPPQHRQEVVHRGDAGRELRRGAGRDPARQAGGRQGQVHQERPHRRDDESGHRARSGARAGPVRKLISGAPIPA